VGGRQHRIKGGAVDVVIEAGFVERTLPTAPFGERIDLTLDAVHGRCQRERVLLPGGQLGLVAVASQVAVALVGQVANRAHR
jgi:hypothetical protein